MFPRTVSLLCGVILFVRQGKFGPTILGAVLATLVVPSDSVADLIINLYPDAGTGVAGDAEGTFGVFTTPTDTGFDLSGNGENLTKLGVFSTLTELSFSHFTDSPPIVDIYRHFILLSSGEGSPFVTTSQPAVMPNVLPLGQQGQLNLSSSGDNSQLRVFVPSGSPVPEASVFPLTYFAMPTWNFSDMNTGTWTWGDFNGSGADGIQLNILPTPIPEPSTLVIFATGGIVLAGWSWRRRRKR